MKNLLSWALLGCLIFAVGAVDAQNQPTHHLGCMSDDATLAMQSTMEENEILVPLAGSCTDPDAVKYVRVNFHFILTEDPANPGNFTETDNGCGNAGYTGIDYSHQLMQSINAQWARNCEAKTYPGNTPPDVNPTRLQMVLKGIYFHRTDEYYDSYSPPSFNSQMAIDYRENEDTEINIFFLEDTNLEVKRTGISVGFYKMIIVGDSWSHYKSGRSTALFGLLVNHEIGHYLGLSHTYYCQNECAGIDVDPYADCNALDSDGNPKCSGNSSNASECNPWNSGSNNLMASSSVSNSLTPCQIERLHSRLEGWRSPYVEECKTYCGFEEYGGTCLRTYNPPLAKMSLPESLEVCDPNDPIEVIMDARWSNWEDSHGILIEKLSASGQVLEDHLVAYDGKIGKVELGDYCNYTFEVGYSYRITLTVWRDECDFNVEDEVTLVVEIYAPQLSWTMSSCIPTDECQFSFCALTNVPEEIESFEWTANVPPYQGSGESFIISPVGNGPLNVEICVEGVTVEGCELSYCKEIQILDCEICLGCIPILPAISEGNTINMCTADGPYCVEIGQVPCMESILYESDDPELYGWYQNDNEICFYTYGVKTRTSTVQITPLNECGVAGETVEWTININNPVYCPIVDDPWYKQEPDKIYSNKIEAFPNPFSEQFTVDVSNVEGEITSVQLFDPFGKKQLDANSKLTAGTTYQFDTSRLSGGVYIIVVHRKYLNPISLEVVKVD